jgi:hypothetical protein
MANKGDVKQRLKEAFARLNERIDSAEESFLDSQSLHSDVLAAELAQARSMLDVIGRRLTAIPSSERADFDRELVGLRARWGEAQQTYDSAMATGGDERARGKERSRAALDDVQDGLLKLTLQMNARFAGHLASPAT